MINIPFVLWMLFGNNGPRSRPMPASLARVRTASQIFLYGAKIVKKPRRGTTGLENKVTSMLGEGSPKSS
jgi:hypothetical protein